MSYSPFILGITALGTAQDNKAFTRASGTATFAGTTIADLGTVTTADINGGTWQGTIDGAWTALGVTCANLGTVSAATSITATDLIGTNIDGIIGADTARAGTFTAIVGSSLSVGDGNITNVGSIACDSVVVDNAAVGLDVVFGGDTTLNKITLTDNLADALNITEGSNSYMKFITTNSTESITFGVDDTGVDVRLFSATASEGVLYDASEDELALLLTTKLKFHDVGGGEEIFASANGHLEINAGTTLDITAPTVDVNASAAITLDTPSLIVSSATANKPLVEIKSTNDDQLGGELRFVATQNDTDGVDADVSGTISFYSNDDGTPTNQEFARIKGIAADTATGSESGKITMGVATTTSGAVADVITIVGGANAAGSTVTIAGNLTVDGTTTTINSTTMTVDDLNVVLASGAADSAAANGAGITIDGASATLLYTHSTTSWDMNKDLNVTGQIATTTDVDCGNDLLLTSSGAIINFNSGNMTITHSAGTLTVAGGTFATAALTASTGTFSGILKTDDSTAATTTTDGSLQTDGGLSVVGDAVVGGFVKAGTVFLNSVDVSVVAAGSITKGFTGVTTSTTNRAMTLPAAVAGNIGAIYTVKKLDAGTGQVQVTAAGSDTVDGGASVVLYHQHESVTVIVGEAAKWYIM